MYINIDSRGIFLLTLFGISGIVLFFDGFRLWRRKRLIENIPTSKIRSMAMGLVELYGEAEPYFILIKAPLTGEDCVFYKYLAERLETKGKNSVWETVVNNASYHNPFYLNDDTGKALINLQHVELHMDDPDFSFETGPLGQEYPQPLLNFLTQNNIRYKSFFGRYRMRFKEWRIHRKDRIYVLGSAQKNKNLASDFKSGLYDKIEQLKSSPAEIKKIDKDRDGEISMDEWGRAVQNIEMNLLEELKNIERPAETDVMIAQGHEEKVFIISEESEKDLVQSLSWKSSLEVFGGALLAIVSLVMLYFSVVKN